MAITEELRHKIYESFRVSHGDEVANGMMEMLPPVGWADVATKDDLTGGLNSLEERMNLRFELLEARMGERLERALKGLEKELRSQANRFIGWLLGVAGVGIAAAGALANLT